MKTNLVRAQRIALLLMLTITLVALSSRQHADTGTCGGQMVTLPFTDMPSSNIFFCAIAEAYFSGLTNGTSATTYSPSADVTREQMAAFVTRTLDQSINRGGRRTALNQRWSPKSFRAMFGTDFLNRIHRVQSDGEDLWVSTNGSLRRVHGQTGAVLSSSPLPTGVQGRGVLVGLNLVFVAGYIPPGTLPGKLYYVSPGADNPPALEYSTSSPLPVLLDGLAFDGERIWVGSQSEAIALVSLAFASPTTTVITGFNQPRNLLYDGANMWVSEFGSDKVHKLDANGAILLTVTVGNNPLTMAFDGTNLWVPNYGSNSVSVVRAVGGLAGTVLATLTGNGLATPSAVAFDGERVLVTNENAQSVSVFRASDLTPLASQSVAPYTPVGACSDGIRFWITSFAGNDGGLLRY